MRNPAEHAPIYEMLEKHAGMNVLSFHVPGHKQRPPWNLQPADGRYESLFPLDVTELPDTDDLHHPLGPIAEAQKLAADCFGAEETRFLIGGSTAGNLAMILGVAAPGDLLIVQRNVHRSILHGLMLAGARAVLLDPSIDRASGLAVIPDSEQIRLAVARHPEAKGVFLCSPNYYGMAGDLGPIVDVCHAAGIPVLVDEAHGPHFGFHSALPSSALQTGADVVVQSTHKMLSAMTMGAMLHMQGKLVRREPIRQALRMVQSSSPSFPLLASIDLARRQLHSQGSSAFEPALKAVNTVRERLQRTRFRALGDTDEPSGQAIVYDPLKLVLYDGSGKMDGFTIRDKLAARGCVAEMADSRYAVLAFGIGSRLEDGEILVHVLTEMSGGTLTVISPGAPDPSPERPAWDADSHPVIPEPVTFTRNEAVTETIPLEESAGRTAGEWIVPYPPGIPVLYPGETITVQAVNSLIGWRKQEARIQGAEDPELHQIRVWRR